MRVDFLLKIMLIYTINKQMYITIKLFKQINYLIDLKYKRNML